MKTFIKAIALTAILTASFAFNTFADDKESKKVNGFATGIFVSKTGRIHVSVDKYTNANTVILLTDIKGNVIYREVVGKKIDKFRKAMNVSDLPLGSYTLEISSNGEKITKAFELTEKETEREITIK